MTDFLISTGDLFTCDAQALVNPVNTVGVMGKGLALQFKNLFPQNYSAYQLVCRDKKLAVGNIHVYETDTLISPQFILNFPTKNHWKDKSEIADIAAGLTELRRIIQERELTSIAIPALGCGLGGLPWPQVRELIQHTLEGLNTTVYLFAPKNAELKPSVSPADSATSVIGAVLSSYAQRVFMFELREVELLCFFIQEAGSHLGLEFETHTQIVTCRNFEPLKTQLTGLVFNVDENGLVHIIDRDHKDSVTLDSASQSIVNRVLETVEGFESGYDLNVLALAQAGEATSQSFDNSVDERTYAIAKEHLNDLWVGSEVTAAFGR